MILAAVGMTREARLVTRPGVRAVAGGGRADLLETRLKGGAGGRASHPQHRHRRGRSTLRCGSATSSSPPRCCARAAAGKPIRPGASAWSGG
ncbi:MAG: hypothetical protein WDN45_06185 [Caulobacteraceae bacterium]